MSHINFVIPHAIDNLLVENDEQYFVQTVVGQKEISQKLKGNLTKSFQQILNLFLCRCTNIFQRRGTSIYYRFF